jgi:hypothetical protein
LLFLFGPFPKKGHSIPQEDRGKRFAFPPSLDLSSLVSEPCWFAHTSLMESGIGSKGKRWLGNVLNRFESYVSYDEKIDSIQRIAPTILHIYTRKSQVRITERCPLGAGFRILKILLTTVKGNSILVL